MRRVKVEKDNEYGYDLSLPPGREKKKKPS